MATIEAEGTQAATLDTLHTLATVTDPGTYELRVDTSALANGETLTLEIHTQVREAGSVQRSDIAVFSDAQASPIKRALPLLHAEGRDLVFKLRQEGGTGRSFPWEVLKA